MLGTMGRTILKNKILTPDKDFTVSPTSTILQVGNTSELTVSVSGGLDIATISADSSDTSKATISIATNKITITGVAEGSATITVKSSEISKTIKVVATVTSTTLINSESIQDGAPIEKGKLKNNQRNKGE